MSQERPENSKQKQGHVLFQDQGEDMEKGLVKSLYRIKCCCEVHQDKDAAVVSTKIRTTKRTCDLGLRKSLVTLSRIILLGWSRWKLNSLGLKS